MSGLLRNLQAASTAVDLLASTGGALPQDRAQALKRLRDRIDEHVAKQSALANAEHGAWNPVSQREGD